MDISRTREALSILESKFEGKTWSEGNQAYYAQILNKRSLSDSTNPRSSRAILGTFKFFGFAWTDQRKLIITPAGKKFVHGGVSHMLRLQLLKWQYPNPFEAKGAVAPYTSTLRLFPFRVLLELVLELGFLHEHELAHLVWKIQSDTKSELERVKSDIQAFRKLSDKERQKLCQGDQFFLTCHEYEAHLRPYMVATNLCSFDDRKRVLCITPAAKQQVRKIVSEKVEVKSDWIDEEEWFEYFGNIKYLHPPRSIELKLRSSKGPLTGVYVKVGQNGLWRVTNDAGIASITLYEGQNYDIDVILPKDGRSVFRGSIRVMPSAHIVDLLIGAAPPTPTESVDVIMEKIHQLLSKGIDNELNQRLNMRSAIEKKEFDRKMMRHVRGARFEHLVYGLLNSFTGNVFDKVVWHGRVGEWGLPTAA